jgi:hypothetical protein
MAEGAHDSRSHTLRPGPPPDILRRGAEWAHEVTASTQAAVHERMRFPPRCQLRSTT